MFYYTNQCFTINSLCVSIYTYLVLTLTSLKLDGFTISNVTDIPTLHPVKKCIQNFVKFWSEILRIMKNSCWTNYTGSAPILLCSMFSVHITPLFDIIIFFLYLTLYRRVIVVTVFLSSTFLRCFFKVFSKPERHVSSVLYT